RMPSRKPGSGRAPPRSAQSDPDGKSLAREGNTRSGRSGRPTSAREDHDAPSELSSIGLHRDQPRDDAVMLDVEGCQRFIQTDRRVTDQDIEQTNAVTQAEGNIIRQGTLTAASVGQ